MDEVNDDYDVVIDVLQNHYNKLWKLTESNMNMNMFNIMDQIRLEQMDKLKKAINIWKEYKK